MRVLDNRKTTNTFYWINMLKNVCMLILSVLTINTYADTGNFRELNTFKKCTDVSYYVHVEYPDYNDSDILSVGHPSIAERLESIEQDLVDIEKNLHLNNKSPFKYLIARIQSADEIIFDKYYRDRLLNLQLVYDSFTQKKTISMTDISKTLSLGANFVEYSVYCDDETKEQILTRDIDFENGKPHAIGYLIYQTSSTPKYGVKTALPY